MSRDVRSAAAVYTRDHVDEVVLDGLLAECTALRRLDASLAERFNATNLVADLWRAAYCRAPELLEPGEVRPAAQINRAIVAAQLGSPEHTELRRTTEGDGFMAALSVVRQGTAIRQILEQLTAEREQAAQAQAAADIAGAPMPGGGGTSDSDDAGLDEDAKGGESTTPGESGESGELGEGGESGAGEEPGGDDGEQDGQDGADAEVTEGGGTSEETGLPEETEGTGGDQGAGTEDGQQDQAAAAAWSVEQELAQALAVAPIRPAARQAAQDAQEALATEQSRGLAWGLGEGDLQRMSADERMQLGQRLASEKLKEFSELIGRFRQLARAQRARRVEHARGEYVGVTLGDDLAALIPSELANLAVPALRAEFAARYAERRLMVFQQRGEEHEAQGAVIALIDCSWSMSDRFAMIRAQGGTPWYGMDLSGVTTAEAYAKALALALLEQARAATPTREFAAILFDETVDKIFRFPANQPVSQSDRIELAERFPGGGTDFERPLQEAAALLEAEYNTTGRQKADLVLITDGDAPVSWEWQRDFKKLQHRLDFRVFGIEIGRGGSTAMQSICDDLRTITDLTDPHATAELFRSI
ncbi:hypothetical protein ABT324_28240 [Saccharopolyspora sp. NPDC000359]|uniref:vWA domain-containing protein n=1 Tax=Saccharopolyspora sp. NPDC000359 TaxID=3154251 RepID=UPI00332C2D64